VAFGTNCPLGPTEIPINLKEGKDAEQSHDGQPYYRTQGFKSMHKGGVNFLLCDGSVHFVNEFIDYKFYNAYGTRAGKEVIQTPID
jgi:prepilin-type processing-associated H-X9-DG protein